ncbi:MAG: hypothetical protein RLT05_32475 [Bauldia litoralis]
MAIPSLLCLVLGVLLVVTAVLDLFLTALTARGGGPIMGVVSRSHWRAFAAVHRWTGRHSLLAHAGWSACLLLAAVWIGLLWAGWTLVFASTPGAIVGSTTGAPADVAARIYYAGYTISTLGTGDYKPGGGAWEIATAVASLTGLLAATMILTYLVPVIGAVAGKRRLAAYLAALGGTPERILVSNWDGEDLGLLDRHLTQILPMVVSTAEQYAVYPILHSFHAGTVDHAFPLRMAALLEAVQLQASLPAGSRLPEGSQAALKRAVDLLLANIERSGVRLSEDGQPPPAPDTARLAGAGLPLAPDAPRAFDRADLRRRTLIAQWLRRDGWDWGHVRERPVLAG